ncbi:hypothetical protein [Aurantiacibacter spongiae]|uniref:Uncharacterized protein n=1 Tax=Aurantiacibacter spongiae TaxID=2488860 RepID=A0A3N5CYN0_9SPHN|nr:hypothetical protein [Aurantiacibacter spongiae]RPF71799.1 hypothetical protein EG799_09340 [Aurantiacibacter spongiae]
MTTIRKALPWAAAMILLALGVRAGIVDRDAARTMFVILPALAWISISGRSCRPSFRRAGE